ncbi:MAG: DUF1592 domain-containing protein [Lentisphaeraceae bacterium]|nr:DUF1592 domain-containing protein [Lentisphaeraceae bacterium]
MKILIYISFLSLFVSTNIGSLHAFSKEENEANNSKLKNFAEKFCLDCHDTETTKGDFDLEKIIPSFTEKNAKFWERMVLRIEAGEMPPPKKKQPEAKEVLEALTWVKKKLAEEAHTRRVSGRVLVRRLNRIEYENSIHDLLGIKKPLKDLLPEDEVSHGFSNSANALSISPVHIQQYMIAADRALKNLIPRKINEPKKYTFSYTDDQEKSFWGHGSNKQFIRPREDKIWFYASTHIEVPAFLRKFSTITRKEPGFYKIKITTKADSTDGKMIAYSFWKAKSGKRLKLIGFFDAHPNKETTIEKTIWFGESETIIVAPYQMSQYRVNAGHSMRQPIKDLPKDWRKSGKFYEPEGPALVVSPVEIEGPINEHWPTKSYTALFGQVPLVGRDKLDKEILLEAHLRRLSVKVAGKSVPALTPAMPEDPSTEAKKLLASFMHKAFRRPISDEDVEPYLNVVNQQLLEKQCFEVAMLVAYKVILCAPDFLFLEERPGKLSDHALASRLSYFLWRSTPDDRLLELADKGELSKPEVLKQEAIRLIKSHKSKVFVRDFLDHWLHLKDIQATTPDKDLYPEYFSSVDHNEQDRLLLYSSIDETVKTFSHLLYENRNSLELIDSEYIWANQRLAEFYGLPEVEGTKLRKVKLPANSVRGGVLTQSSVLKVTANGATTSPVVRGVWLLENIMAMPAPPPPPNAGSIEPDTRGATTVREQLEKHKSTKSCAACHRMIDPPGFALEAFDPIGLERKHYRGTGEGEAVDNTFFFRRDFKKVKFKRSAKVDATGTLFSKFDFNGPKEFKKHLLTQSHNIMRCLTGKLVTFATGHHPEPGDLLELDRIVNKNKAQNHGLQSLILEIIQSPLFTRK